MISDQEILSAWIVSFEREGWVTRTFRRLDPERQMAVVRAIFDEAAESGPEKINIKQVAARAGVAVGSLYQYFGSRERLLDFSIEMATRMVTQQFDGYREALAQLPLRDALAAYGAGGVEWARQSGGLVAFFARAAYGGDPRLAERVVRPVSAAMLGMVREILLAARARGELRDDVDLEAAAHALHAFSIALYDPLLLPYLNDYFFIHSESVPAERTLSAALDLILRGILRDDPR